MNETFKQSAANSARDEARPASLYYILAALLCAAVVAAMYTSSSQIGNMLIRSAEFSIVKIQKHLDEYHQAHGVYPERLEDLPDFKPAPSAIITRGAFFDSWGVPFEYNPSGENAEQMLRSIRLEKEIAQRKIRGTCHYVANGCLLVLIPLILYVRYRRDGRWPVQQSVMLLLPVTLCFYLPILAIPFKGMLTRVPLFYSVLYFYAMFFSSIAVTLGSFVQMIRKRDILYFAAFVSAFHVWLVVFSLVS